MNASFGPWTITMVRVPQTRLSTFWRKRMVLLPLIRTSRTPRSAPAILALILGALVLGVWPMLRVMPVLAEAPRAEKKSENQGPKPNAESPPAGAPAKAAVPSADDKTPTKNPFFYRIENLSNEKDLASGLFQFRLHVSKGVRFGVELRSVAANENGAGAGGLFESETEAPVIMSVSFRRLDGKTGSALMSKDKLIQYDIECPDAYPYGMTSVMSMPFANIDGADLKMELPARATDWGAQGQFERRAMIIYPKSARAKDFELTKPRIEIAFYAVNKETRRATDANEAPLSRLNRVWRHQERLIGSAALRFRHISSGGSGLKGLSRVEFDAALADLDLAKRPDDLIQFSDRIHAEKIEGHRWGIKELACLGPKFRETSMDGDGKPSQLRVSDGDLDLIYDVANHQVDVWKTGDSTTGHTSLFDFVNLPDFRGQKSTVTVKVADGTATIAGQSVSIEVDEETGFVRRWSSHHDDDSHESRYFGCDRFPGGILFPRAVVGAGFHKDRLNRLQVFVIEKAQMNESLPDDTFRLSVPAKTNVWDMRHDTFRRQFRGAAPAMTDVLEYLAVKDAAKAKQLRD